MTYAVWGPAGDGGPPTIGSLTIKDLQTYAVSCLSLLAVALFAVVLLKELKKAVIQ